MYHKFDRVHQTLRVTPAMEAGGSDHVWSVEEIVTCSELDTIVNCLTCAGSSLLSKISRMLLLFAVGSALVGCSRGTPITVINQSDAALDDVELVGSGFSKDIGSVPPNAASRVFVRTEGESGVQIRFNARGNTVAFGPDGYFEAGGGYIVTVTVSPSLAVTVKSELAY